MGVERMLMPKPAGWTLFTCLLISAVLALSGVVVSGLAIVSSPTPWLTVAFELLIVFSGVFGVLLGLRRFPEGPAIGLVCVAGAVGVGALLGGVAAEWRVGTGSGLALKQLLLVRVALCGVLVAIAGFIVLSRDWRAARGLFLKGMFASVALVALLAGAYFGRGAVGQLGSMSKAIAAMAGFVLATGLLAAAAQWLISAFETGSAARFEVNVRGQAGTNASSVGGGVSAVGGAGTAVKSQASRSPSPTSLGTTSDGVNGDKLRRGDDSGGPETTSAASAGSTTGTNADPCG